MAGLRVWRGWRAGQGPQVPLSAPPTCSQAPVRTSLWPLDDPTLPGASSSDYCWWRLGIKIGRSTRLNSSHLRSSRMPSSA